MGRFDRGVSNGRPRLSIAGGPLHCEIQDVVAGGWHTLRIAGELDLASSTLLDSATERISMTGVDGIALDLSEVSFIDSTGVRAIIVLDKRCQERGTEFRIIPGSSVVQRVFEVCGLLEVLPFVPDGVSPVSG